MIGNFFSYRNLRDPELRDPERHLLHVGSIKGGDASPITNVEVLSHTNSSNRYLTTHTINTLWSLFRLGVVNNTPIMRSLPLLSVGVFSLFDWNNAKSIFSTDPNVVCERCYENTRTLSGSYTSIVTANMTIYNFFHNLIFSFFAPAAPFIRLYHEKTWVPHPTTPFFSSLGKLMGSAVTQGANLATAALNIGPEGLCAIDDSSVSASRIFNFFSLLSQDIPYRSYFDVCIASSVLYKDVPTLLPQLKAYRDALRGAFLRKEVLSFFQNILGANRLFVWMHFKMACLSSFCSSLYVFGSNLLSFCSDNPEFVCPPMQSNLLRMITYPIRLTVGNWIVDPFKYTRAIFVEETSSTWGISSAISSVTNPIFTSIGHGFFYLADRVYRAPEGGRIKATCLSERGVNVGGRLVNFMGGYVKSYRSLYPYFSYYFAYQKYVDAIVSAYLWYQFILTQYNYFIDKEGDLAVESLKKNFAEMTTTLKELSRGNIETQDDRFKGLNLKKTADKIASSKEAIIEELDQLGLEQLDDETKNQLVDPLIQAARAIIEISPD